VFLASALFVVWIKPPNIATTRRRHAREEGLRFLWGNSILRALTTAALLYAVSSRLITVVLLLYLNRELGFGAGALGTIFAVGGATSIVGAFMASRSRWFGGLGPALIVAAFLRSAGVVFLALPWDNGLASAAILVCGQLFDSAWTFYNVNELSLRQSVTDARLQGRVHATTRFLEFGAMVVGTLVAGYLGQAIGFRETLVVAVGFQFLAAVTLLFSPVTRLREAPAGDGRHPSSGRAASLGTRHRGDRMNRVRASNRQVGPLLARSNDVARTRSSDSDGDSARNPHPPPTSAHGAQRPPASTAALTGLPPPGRCVWCLSPARILVLTQVSQRSMAVIK
jgi:MFS family permease